MREAGLVAAEILDDMCEAAKPGVSTWELDQIARARDREAQGDERVPRLRTRRTRPCCARRSTRSSSTASRARTRSSRTATSSGSTSGSSSTASAPTPPGPSWSATFRPRSSSWSRPPARPSRTAIELCRPGNRIGDVGHAVQSYAESHGYSVVRQFVGHGTGRQMHEDPQVPNFTDDGRPGSGKRMKTGLVIAVEPMVNAGAPEVEVLDDNWTAVTKDRSMSAHFEHTIAITDDGPWVLTRPSRPREAVEQSERAMKVRASVKPICPKCKVIKRKGVVRIICTNPRTSSVRVKG